MQLPVMNGLILDDTILLVITITRPSLAHEAESLGTIRT